jgi:hypothetical protein
MCRFRAAKFGFYLDPWFDELQLRWMLRQIASCRGAEVIGAVDPETWGVTGV